MLDNKYSFKLPGQDKNETKYKEMKHNIDLGVDKYFVYFKIIVFFFLIIESFKINYG